LFGVIGFTSCVGRNVIAGHQRHVFGHSALYTGLLQYLGILQRVHSCTAVLYVDIEFARKTEEAASYETAVLLYQIVRFQISDDSTYSLSRPPQFTVVMAHTYVFCVTIH
jgi:hypothetical protein